MGNTPKEQETKLAYAVPALVDLAAKGYAIIITHGNGPQVGMIKNAFAESGKYDLDIPDLDLPECTAMSQGYIGFHLQKAIRKELNKRELSHHIATIVTQIVVDPHDKAFLGPTKPIGPYYTRKEAEKISANQPNAVFTNDTGRGFRQLVPSPKPLKIIEKDAIEQLLVRKFIVIACGGGGIPIIKSGFSGYKGVNAVIDKDFAAAKLAEEVNARYLFILTNIDHVSLNFRTKNETPLAAISTKEAKQYIDEGQFADGSMLPKMEAAVDFAESGPNRTVVIAALEKAADAIDGKTGTRITADQYSEGWFVPAHHLNTPAWFHQS